ncbi:amidase [Streptomyces cuspidosporus]|uniref:Amidase n=1 Tax=Streptomyces cuspidosporus TaxID=66882 RepID=A0ABP5U9E5_9ACTN
MTSFCPTTDAAAAADPDAAAPGLFAGRTISELATELRAGRTTSVELTRHALEAIAGSGPRVNAFAHVDAGGALAAARQADREIGEGLDRGPLHGLPTGIKDMIDVAGLPTTAGSAHLAGRVARTDAACVRRLRRAGAVIVGKTTTHEFAYGPTGDRSVHGPTRNPRDLTRMAGGSSAGSAAAVAAGMVAFALGTDTGGSVRIPSALCGVVGFKPAYDAIPTHGVLPLSRTLDHVGVLAPTVRDCLTVHDVLAEREGRGHRLDGAAADAGLAPDTGRVGGLTVGWLTEEAPPPGDPRVAATVRRALETAVGTVPDVVWRRARACRDAFSAIQGAEASALHARRMEQAPGLYDEEVLRRLQAASAVSPERYAAALDTRAALIRAVGELFGRHDVLALPTVPITAPPLGAREVAPDGRVIPVRDALLSLTSPWNVLGLPAFSVPAGAVDGLPVALQLVCRPGDEAKAAALAHRLTP